jgi:HSP20 family molecular chaperone IbpA
LAKRAFTRTWTLSDDVEVKDVSFEDGLLTIKLKELFQSIRRERCMNLNKYN